MSGLPSPIKIKAKNSAYKSTQEKHWKTTPLVKLTYHAATKQAGLNQALKNPAVLEVKVPESYPLWFHKSFPLL